MATRYASLFTGARCSGLPERDVIGALISREECAALLARIAAMPSAKLASRALLGLIGRLATPACVWLEGELAVELFEEDGATKVRVMSEIGAGLRERVLPVVIMAQPLDALLVGFERRRELVTFLRLERVSSRCAMLLAYDASDEEGVPASAQFDISETSLAWASSRDAGAAPEEVDSGWDAP